MGCLAMLLPHVTMCHSHLLSRVTNLALWCPSQLLACRHLIDWKIYIYPSTHLHPPILLLLLLIFRSLYIYCQATFSHWTTAVVLPEVPTIKCIATAALPSLEIARNQPEFSPELGSRRNSQTSHPPFTTIQPPRPCCRCHSTLLTTGHCLDVADFAVVVRVVAGDTEKFR